MFFSSHEVVLVDTRLGRMLVIGRPSLEAMENNNVMVRNLEIEFAGLCICITQSWITKVRLECATYTLCRPIYYIRHENGATRKVAD
jgi:hypothetical protein